MKTLIAIAGKGGSGKTTLASLFIRMLKNDASSILAIDADPNNNLWQWLGLPPVGTIMDVVEDMSKNKEKIPSGMTKERYIDFKIQESIEEFEGFDLLSMGRPEGPGCYCYANNLLRGLIENLSKNYDIVVVDNEAGMEHLSRRLMRSMDFLFIVSDFSAVGIRSAKNISDLANNLDIKAGERCLVLNKVTGSVTPLKKEIDKTGLALGGIISYDKNLEKISISDGSIFDLQDSSPVIKDLDNILDKIK